MNFSKQKIRYDLTDEDFESFETYIQMLDMKKRPKDLFRWWLTEHGIHPSLENIMKLTKKYIQIIRSFF